MSNHKHHYLGLNNQEVLESRKRYGTNELTLPEKESLWTKFLEKFRDPIIIILIIAMILSFLVSCYNYFITAEDQTGAGFFEPIGVLFAILLATGVAFYFELKSEKEFELLNQTNNDIPYKVIRNGKISQVKIRDLVVGDILLLETGEAIPADAKLLEAISLQVDESSLTGEPLTRKSTDPKDLENEATFPIDHIYRGTTVIDGHCICQIEKVGDTTEYGRIFEGVQIDSSVETPLNKQLDGLSSLITKISYILATLILLGSTIMFSLDGGFNQSLGEILSYFLGKIMIAVTVIVVAVPEGLPMSVSLSLAYSMRSMMKSNNLVRRMHACETMGAATVICTDKTGTLTENKMAVADTIFSSDINTELLAEAIATNSTAHLDSETNQVLGNPTEGALLLWLQKEGKNYLTIRERIDIIEQLTFSTERKYMATVVNSEALGQKVLFVKGAPELVMKMSDISAESKQTYQEAWTEYQRRAMRTIAFAYLPLAEGDKSIEGGKVTATQLKFMGVIAITDPIRPDVPKAIRRCMDAGIQVKIITGDMIGTAKEIGRQIGVWDDDCSEQSIITGEEFASLTDEELLERIQDLRIMARARPLDKERLVRLLQERGEIVAVTGDGTNDAPALHRAHVGLSMGDGTAVAKEASDITILDNSFASISQTVLWGRSLYLNIQRFILFQMTINVVACVIVLLGSFLGVESPLTVTQMLWVNLIMDTFAALALASLPPSKQVMKEKPRKQTDHIISKPMAHRILGVGFLFVVLLLGLLQYIKNVDLVHIQDFSFRAYLTHFFSFSHTEHSLSPYELSIFFTLFVFLQFWNMFNAKAYHSGRSALAYLSKCKNFLVIALLILIGQVLITTFAYQFFEIQPLDLSSWGISLIGTSLVLWIGELFRLRR